MGVTNLSQIELRRPIGRPQQTGLGTEEPEGQLSLTAFRASTDGGTATDLSRLPQHTGHGPEEAEGQSSLTAFRTSTAGSTSADLIERPQHTGHGAEEPEGHLR